ncbi:hypothetical protein FOA43_003900 [Brettanomyces nanus]|uniref:Phosphoglycerate mutase n=1 Tax=Eeniella nana TaxID=13502 RepID=A0A875S4D6_EENNA|nr:uncharacterized protein FOA43_003900 [Brettanomyces nanus]QPG76511.1 hypothetical protein FOA43_003900 [Brettanomyces nanus]
MSTIKLTDCDVHDAHGSMEEVNQYGAVRLSVEGKKDPRTGKLLRPWHFEDVPGFFKQSNPNTDDSTFDLIGERFGLELKSWQEVIYKVNELNKNAKANEQYKLVFCGRHGQGNHNAAVSIFGLKEWDEKWACTTGTTLADGTRMVWGPDPKLTDLGRQQVSEIHEALLKELKQGLPLPTKFYSSPFTRAASTLVITWKGISVCRDGDDESQLVSKKRYHPLVMENLRETIGKHLCDKRGTKSDFIKNLRVWGFKFEPGFPEEDVLFKDDWRESVLEQCLRADLALQEIFEDPPKDEVIYTASHGGEIRSFITAIGHRPFSIPTAGFIPLLIKGTRTQN